MWFVFWWCVGARWCPTLPFPGGSSTMGAGGLSFRVRDGSGRVPVAVTTETSGWAVRCVDSCVWWPRPRTHTCVCVRVCGVGGGLGVDRIVDALMLTVVPLIPRTVLWWVGGCCLCWPISTSQLQPLPVFHFWPINPVVCWGPTRKDESFLRRPCLEDGFPLRCFQRLSVSERG